MLFSFGRDTNILWKHGINALTEAEQAAEPRGRVSIILWGLCPDVIEEKNSPPLLTDNTRGNGYSVHAGRPDSGLAPPRREGGDRFMGRDERRDAGDRSGHPGSQHSFSRDERDHREPLAERAPDRNRDRDRDFVRDRDRDSEWVRDRDRERFQDRTRHGDRNTDDRGGGGGGGGRPYARDSRERSRERGGGYGSGHGSQPLPFRR